MLVIPMMSRKASVPFLYRFVFLYFEPVAAFFGTLVNLLDPVRYLQSLSPTATASTYSPATQPIYDQLAAHLLFFAWSQAVVLRSTDDTRVWKTVLFGMFLCDVLHLYGSYKVLGSEIFLDLRTWRWEEWVNFLMLYGPGSLRLAYCVGIGLEEDRKAGKKH